MGLSGDDSLKPIFHDITDIKHLLSKAVAE